MTAVARNVVEEQRRAWVHYTERLRGLEGEDYDRAENDAWDELQATLRELDISPPRSIDGDVQ